MDERLPYRWLERERREEAADHLRGGLYGLDEATEALARTMEPLSVSASGDASATYWLRTAVMHVAAIGLRTARATGVLVEAGYAPEALGQFRQLHESVDLIRHIAADPQGNRARNWLLGEGSKTKTPSRIAREHGSYVAFTLLSRRHHVTPYAVAAFRGPVDAESRVPITVVPLHDVEQSESILFAVGAMLISVCELLADIWAQVDEDPALERIRVSRKVDKRRHTPVEELLASRPSPFAMGD